MIATRAEILVALGRSASATAAELALIDMLMPLVSGVVADYLHKSAGYQQHVEFLPIGQPDVDNGDLALGEATITGNRVVFDTNFEGSSVLQLSHTPVWLTGLEIREDVGGYAGQADSSFGSDTILTEGSDYYLDVDDATNNLSNTGRVFSFGTWPTEPRSVKVTYYGGHTAAQLNGEIAGAIKMAEILSNVKAFNQLKAFQSNEAGPKTNESIGKYSYGRGLNNVFAGGGFTIPYEAQRLLSPHRSFAGLMG